MSVGEGVTGLASDTVLGALTLLAVGNGAGGSASGGGVGKGVTRVALTTVRGIGTGFTVVHLTYSGGTQPTD